MNDRDCENCIHKINGACKVWECEFEPKRGMTKEEAISIMKVIVHMLEEKYDTDRVEEAVDMAIEALEQKPICPSAGIDCEDCPASSSEKPNRSEWEQDHEILKAYSDGASAVLDKIRAEIDEQYDRVHPYDISCAEGLEMALNIIDKYREPTGTEEG